MDGGPDSSCVGRVSGLGSAVHGTSSAPDDRRMRPKHVELRIYQ